jgi:UDP-glucose 4-epimerase
MLLYLVTGGAGFIGSHIVDALLEGGHQVRVLDNLSTGNLKNLSHVADRIEFIEGDVREAQAVAKAVRKVDCVFHQAALPSVPRSVENPLETHHACITGTLNVLNESRLAGVQRVVYAGSSSAYGNLAFSSKRETDRPGPLSPYAVAKLSGEYYCHAFYQTYGLQTVAIRYFNVFGPRQDPNSAYSAVIPLFIGALLKGQRPVIYGDGLQSRDFTFVKNVVHGNLLASQAQGVGGRVFNVAGGRTFSLLELLAKLNNYLGTSVDPIHKDPRTGDVKHSLADITQASQALSYEPVVDFDAGLQVSIDYYRTLLS